MIPLILSLLLVFSGGCATDDAIPQLSDEELRMVEEYAAHLLLKYDSNYRATTLKEEEMAAERERLERLAAVQAQIAKEKAEKEQKMKEESHDDGGKGDGSGEGGGPGSQEPVYTDIDEFFGIEGLDISYSGMMSVSRYPLVTEDNSWQGVVNATAGNTLLVFSYTIENVSGTDQLLDMASYSPRFTFRINNSFSKASMMTLLQNDLALYRDTIPAGESREAVLVIEITQAQASEAQRVTMIMRGNEGRGELTLAAP